MKKREEETERRDKEEEVSLLSLGPELTTLKS